MKNITVSLPEEVARWARIRAAEQDTSVSAMLSSFLKAEMERDRNYRAAMKSFLSCAPQTINSNGSYPAREELYER